MLGLPGTGLIVRERQRLQCVVQEVFAFGRLRVTTGCLRRLVSQRSQNHVQQAWALLKILNKLVFDMGKR